MGVRGRSETQHPSPGSVWKLEDLPYLDRDALRGRTVPLLHWWNGRAWRWWVPAPEQERLFVEMMAPGGPLSGLYLSSAGPESPDTDLLVRCIDAGLNGAFGVYVQARIGQLATAIRRMLRGIDRVHTHWTLTRANHERALLAFQVESDIRQLFMDAVIGFDILSDLLVRLHRDSFSTLESGGWERKPWPLSRKEVPKKYRQWVFKRDENERLSGSEIIEKLHAIPAIATRLAASSTLFAEVNRIRNAFAHERVDDVTVFDGNEGYALSYSETLFDGCTGWDRRTRVNDNLYRVEPAMASMALAVITCWDDILMALAEEVPLLPAVAPTCGIYLRDPSVQRFRALLAELDVADGCPFGPPGA